MNEYQGPKAGTSNSGLSPTPEDVALVMDLGGNWIRVALASRDGDLLWREREPTNSSEGGPAVTARVDRLIQLGISQAGRRRIAGIGMGLASPVDPETGIMYNPPHIPGLDGVSFKSLWEKKLGLPILVGNDATLAALGEYRYGSGVDARVLVYITISTGIGGGVVIDGRPLMGAFGMAGELGHMSIDRNGPRCQCGGAGHLEAVASGTSIANSARKWAADKARSVMWELVSGDLGLISSERVFEAAARGDSTAQEILEDAARALGMGLVNVLHVLNPDVIVIGGGVSRNWDYLRQTVESYIEAQAMDHVKKLGFELRVSALGDEIGLLGAAALVWHAEQP